MLGKHEYFENVPIRDIYTSRFAASWFKAGGSFKTHADRHKFRLWLKQLKINGSYLDDDEIHYIFCMMTNGKLELEENAKAFLTTN